MDFFTFEKKYQLGKSLKESAKIVSFYSILES